MESSRSSKSKSSSSRPRVCRSCGQHHSHHEPHIYDYPEVRHAKLIKYGSRLSSWMRSWFLLIIIHHDHHHYYQSKMFRKWTKTWCARSAFSLLWLPRTHRALIHSARWVIVRCPTRWNLYFINQITEILHSNVPDSHNQASSTSTVPQLIGKF